MLRSRSTASTSPRRGELDFALEAGADPARDQLRRARQARRRARGGDRGRASRSTANPKARPSGRWRSAERLGRTPRLAVRVNPDFEIKGSGMRMGGGAKPFGVDAARVPALVRRILDAGADWRGFHIFAGSQALDAEALIEAQAATRRARRRACRRGRRHAAAGQSRRRLRHSLFPRRAAARRRGGRRGACARRSAAAPGDPRATAASRSSSAAGWSAKAGVYLTRIVDRKVSHGKTFLVTDGGMHHQLAASGNFGQVVRRNYPVAIASRFGAAPEEEVEHRRLPLHAARPARR